MKVLFPTKRGDCDESFGLYIYYIPPKIHNDNAHLNTYAKIVPTIKILFFMYLFTKTTQFRIEKTVFRCKTGFDSFMN